MAAALQSITRAEYHSLQPKHSGGAIGAVLP
jgi:hypothetical protein